MTSPTPRQLDVLRAISRHIQKWAYPPSMRELGLVLRIVSTNGVRCHLNALERKGLISRDERISRGMRLTARGEKAVAS